MQDKNQSDLSKILAKAIIKEMIAEGFSPYAVKKIVTETDLEAEFLGDQMNAIARRVREIEELGARRLQDLSDEDQYSFGTFAAH